MYTRLCNYLITMTCVTLLFSATASAEDRALSLEAIEVANPTTIKVNVDNAQYIAGAAFTITYDTVSLTLDSIESGFFQTFVLQIPTETECFTLGDDVYCSPIVDNTVSTGTMLAAATVNRGELGIDSLFDLEFGFKEDALPGEYSIAIEQSKIFNPSAGYGPTDGDPITDAEPIDMLVGIDDNGGYPAYNIPTLADCSLVINTADIDFDEDGIDDIWESYYRPKGVWDAADVLTHYTATGDYDGDGYSDLVEYTNWRNEIEYPTGTAFDPASPNDAGGPGYVSTRIALPAVNLLLLSD